MGVRLRGASGAGKSELGQELISCGHRLIADDAVDFQREAAGVVGRCPPLLEGFIEVRGEATAEERLNGRRSECEVLGLSIAQISLPRRVGHNLAVLVEAACRDHRHRAAGYKACDDLAARQAQALQNSHRPKA